MSTAPDWMWGSPLRVPPPVLVIPTGDAAKVFKNRKAARNLTRYLNAVNFPRAVWADWWNRTHRPIRGFLDWLIPWQDCPCGSQEHQAGGHPEPERVR